MQTIVVSPLFAHRLTRKAVAKQNEMSSIYTESITRTTDRNPIKPTEAIASKSWVLTQCPTHTHTFAKDCYDPVAMRPKLRRLPNTCPQWKRKHSANKAQHM